MPARKINTSESKNALRMWLRLLRCESMIEQHIRSKLRENFSTTLPQFDVLAELDYENKPMSMSDLSTKLMVSNGNITGVVDRLTRDGHVERVTDSGDRRVQLVSLSQAGRKEFRKMASAHEAWLAELFEDIDKDSISMITGLLSDASDKLKAKTGATES